MQIWGGLVLVYFIFPLFTPSNDTIWFRRWRRRCETPFWLVTISSLFVSVLLPPGSFLYYFLLLFKIWRKNTSKILNTIVWSQSESEARYGTVQWEWPTTTKQVTSPRISFRRRHQSLPVLFWIYVHMLDKRKKRSAGKSWKLNREKKCRKNFVDREVGVSNVI